MRRRRLGSPLVIAYDLADELAHRHPYDPLTGRCRRCPWWTWPCPSASFADATKNEARPHS